VPPAPGLSHPGPPFVVAARAALTFVLVLDDAPLREVAVHHRPRAEPTMTVTADYVLIASDEPL
jgi:hypothetical protein